jgi:hypothetical protein
MPIMDLNIVIFMAFLALLLLALMALVFGSVVLNQRQQARLREQENDLKRDLVAKGVSADEIERIIKATADETKSAPQVLAETIRATGPGADRAHLVKVLCEQGMEGGDVERLLRVVGEYPDEQLPAKIAAIQSMVENGMEAGDIERVLRAFQHSPGAPDAASDRGQTAFRE